MRRGTFVELSCMRFLLLPVSALAAVLVAFPLSADIVKLDDGRELRGEVIDKGDKIEVKTKLGSITVEKSKIVSRTKEDDSSGKPENAKPGTRTAAKKTQTYRSLLLGFALEVPDGGWILKRCPPEPLCDVAVYNPRWDGKILVSIRPASLQQIDFSEAGAKAFSEALVRSFCIYYDGLKTDSAEVFSFKDGKALKVRMTGARKGLLKDNAEALVFVAFPRKDTNFVLKSSAPAKRLADLDKVLSAVLESLIFFEPKECDGDMFTNFKYGVGVTKPADWQFKTDADCVVAMNSPDGKTTFTLKAVEGDFAKEQLSKIGKSMQESAKKSHPDAQFEQSRMANVKGIVCWELAYKCSGALWREHFFFAAGNLLQSVFSCPANATDAQQVLETLFDGLQVYRDMVSKGSMETGVRAMELAYEGDKLNFSGKYEESLRFYDDAVAAFPSFSAAHNNKGLALNRLEKRDEAVKCFERARELWPDDPLVGCNLALVRFARSLKLLQGGKVSPAIEEYEAAVDIGERYEELAQELNAGNIAIGKYYFDKQDWDKAATWFRKGLKLAPKSEDLKQSLANCCFNAAQEYANRKDYSRARSKAKECFKYVPDHKPAKDLLENIDQMQKSGG